MRHRSPGSPAHVGRGRGRHADEVSGPNARGDLPQRGWATQRRVGRGMRPTLDSRTFPVSTPKVLRTLRTADHPCHARNDHRVPLSHPLSLSQRSRVPLVEFLFLRCLAKASAYDLSHRNRANGVRPPCASKGNTSLPTETGRTASRSGYFAALGSRSRQALALCRRDCGDSAQVEKKVA